jgi:hypothetical protein
VSPYEGGLIEDVVFARGVEGLSFLDLMAGRGEYCLEALRQGAASATGLEFSPELLRTARAIAAAEGLRAEFIPADLEDWTAAARAFDVVVFLGELHHLYDPLFAIRKIMQLAAGRFYLKVSPLPRWGLSREAISGRLWGAANPPVMLLGAARHTNRQSDRTFTFTRQAIEIIINRHSKAYEPIRFHPSRKNNHWIAEGLRREIDHLVVVGGSSGSGKSTFIKRLCDPRLRARFGIEDDYVVAKPGGLDTLPCGPIGTVVYHYDLLRPFYHTFVSHSRDPAFQLLSCSARTTVITLAVPAPILRQRTQERRTRGKARGLDPLGRWKLFGMHYNDPMFLADWYALWFSSVERYARRPQDRTFHILADTSDNAYPELPGCESVFRLFAAA